MSSQLLLTWYVVESSQPNSTDIDAVVAEYVQGSVDAAFNRLTDHTDRGTVIISLSPLQEVLVHLIAEETSGNRSQHLGIAIDLLERLIATAEEEEDLYDDAL